MGNIRWIVVQALLIAAVTAAPRELSSDELITEPRPGEEYVNIQTNSQDKIKTSPGKVNLQEQSFTTSHRIPQKKVTFETAHKVPPVEIASREFSKEKSNIEPSLETFQTAETKRSVRYEVSEEEPIPQSSVEVVTRTSVKMSKSKKIQKSALKVPHEVELDFKSSEGTIDETATADKVIKDVMAKKHEHEEPEQERKPLRFNVPFEDEVEVTGKPQLLAVGPASSSTLKVPTTEEPPITTFNYKNVYDMKKLKEKVEIISGKNEKVDPDKYRYEVLSSESIKTAESRALGKKDTKQEKKSKLPKKEQDTGFYVLPVNKGTAQVADDNFDFVDLDEKVLESAGSSPGQSSRINIKKGPNGQEYEYVYYYYYYDDDEGGRGNGTGKTKEEKVPATTEKVYNGHDGPALESYHEKDTVKSSTSGNRYLPTESPKAGQKFRKKPDDYANTSEKELPEEHPRENTRYSSINRQAEAATNEIVPATSIRPQSRSRGRITNIPVVQPVPADDIPAINEERLPANTRFPPRARNNSPTSPPQPQESTTRTRSDKNRVRLPNLGLLDSSSFRTHSSDASIDEDPIHDAELQRRPGSRAPAQVTEAPDRRDEITTLSHRRGRPTTTTTTTPLPPEEIPEVPVQRRPISRRPVEHERLPVPQAEEDEEVPLPVQEENIEKITGSRRRPETTRESDLEEGDFGDIKTTNIPNYESKVTEVTTEEGVGLTSALMEKAALDLYAIIQQTQDENILTNFVDGNETEITTEDEGYTEVTTFPPTTTSTTTTTTEPPTTTTTTQAPTTVAAGRGRYRTRGGAGGLSKGRAKPTSTTTEAPPEPSSQRPRGRFQPHHGNRAPGQGSRRAPKPKVDVVEEEAAPKEEAPKPAAERTFGGRNRFRGAIKPSTTTTTTAAPAQISGGAQLVANRGSSIDRFNSRRRGNRISVSTTSQPTGEDNLEVAKEEVPQEPEVSHPPEETTSAALRPGVRIHAGGARPLRPGPRVPLHLAPRGRVASTTPQPAAVEGEEHVVEKEVAEAEPSAQPEEEPAATPPPDPLSRLKNRQRLRIVPGAPQQRPAAQPGAVTAVGRKKLVSPLLAKRRPGEEKSVEKQEEPVEEKHEEEVIEEEAAAPAVEPSSTTEADTKGLPGLLNGRRRNLIRRPGTLYSRQPVQQQPQAEAA